MRRCGGAEIWNHSASPRLCVSLLHHFGKLKGFDGPGIRTHATSVSPGRQKPHRRAGPHHSRTGEPAPFTVSQSPRRTPALSWEWLMVLFLTPSAWWKVQYLPHSRKSD